MFPKIRNESSWLAASFSALLLQPLDHLKDLPVNPNEGGFKASQYKLNIFDFLKCAHAPAACHHTTFGQRRRKHC